MERYIIEAMNAATELMMKSDRNFPEIGIEMSVRHGTECIVLDRDNLSYRAIEELIEKSVGYTVRIDFDSAIDLTDEEYEIRNYGFTCLNTWGKLSIQLEKNGFTDDGTYVILHGDKAIEIELYNYHRWEKRSTLQPSQDYDQELKSYVSQSKKLDELTNVGKAKELEVYYLPPHHMWKAITYDMYPCDDPGYVFGTYIEITDKATGVPYQQVRL